jgi:hypothetical protein
MKKSDLACLLSLAPALPNTALTTGLITLRPATSPQAHQIR